MIERWIDQREYSNGKRYDPATFKNPTKGNVIKSRKPRVNQSKPAVLMELQIEIEAQGYALVKTSEKIALQSAARRAGVHWYFKKYDERTTKIINAPE